MKKKLIPGISTALILAGVLTSAASAQVIQNVTLEAGVNVDVGTQGSSANVQAEAKGNATSSTAKTSPKGNATSTEAKTNRGVDVTASATTSTNAQGQTNANAHRSTVSLFVKTLLAVADRSGGIGQEVRLVAQSQQDSASTSAEAIAKVESRGALRNFLFGTDYKSIGDLRSEMSTTSANINKLKDILSRTTDASVKAEISAQIQILENTQAQIDTFVTAHESSFSLFGWFNKRLAN